ncbi:hypothetical protein DRN69_06380 [Candidatus Pacearchaeota archaeon]|nr:MAG: hypothetical protein DRN69_06380 [Candidatus Pacearchaeota archaeon]
MVWIILSLSLLFAGKFADIKTDTTTWTIEKRISGTYYFGNSTSTNKIKVDGVNSELELKDQSKLYIGDKVYGDYFIQSSSGIRVFIDNKTMAQFGNDYANFPDVSNPDYFKSIRFDVYPLSVKAFSLSLGRYYNRSSGQWSLMPRWNNWGDRKSLTISCGSKIEFNSYDSDNNFDTSLTMGGKGMTIGFGSGAEARGNTISNHFIVLAPNGEWRGIGTAGNSAGQIWAFSGFKWKDTANELRFYVDGYDNHPRYFTWYLTRGTARPVLWLNREGRMFLLGATSDTIYNYMKDKIYSVMNDYAYDGGEGVLEICAPTYVANGEWAYLKKTNKIGGQLRLSNPENYDVDTDTRPIGATFRVLADGKLEIDVDAGTISFCGAAVEGLYLEEAKHSLTSDTATYSWNSDKLDGLDYTAFVSTTGDTMSGDLDMNGNKLIRVKSLELPYLYSDVKLGGKIIGYPGGKWYIGGGDGTPALGEDLDCNSFSMLNVSSITFTDGSILNTGKRIANENNIQQLEEYIIRGSTIIPAGGQSVINLSGITKIVNVMITPYGEDNFVNLNEIWLYDVYVSSFVIANGETDDIKCFWQAIVK